MVFMSIWLFETLLYYCHLGREQVRDEIIVGCNDVQNVELKWE